MSPRKLTEEDKQEILELYRTSKATTSTLATQYEVSSSTISRFLKNSLSQSEYEELIQQKRLARTPRGDNASAKDDEIKPTGKTKAKSSTKTDSEVQKSSQKSIVAIDKVESTSDSKNSGVTRRRRRRASAATEVTESDLDVQSNVQLELETTISQQDQQLETEPVAFKPSDRLILKKDRLEEAEDEEIERVEVITLKEMLGEDVEDDDEDDEEDDDDWELETDDDIAYPHADKDFDVQIIPLSAASLPRTCYLVIDRYAELIVKPLKDFADLGSIPETEIKQKTLPIFDNHRIAKRFSHRRERVIKVPDSRILHKTSHYLEAKGITRLLVDGKIYSLSTEV